MADDKVIDWSDIEQVKAIDVKHPTYLEKIKWDLETKEFHFYLVLDKFYHAMGGNVYMMFSGGKDSTVMWHLIKKWLKLSGYPPITVAFNDTTNEHKQILDFVKEFGDEVTWLRPKMTFAQTLVKYGFPLISKEQSMAISRYKLTKREDQKVYRMTGVKPDGTKGIVGVIKAKWRFVVDAPFNVTNRCCDILKKEPAKRFEKKTGLRPIIGTMAEESRQRRMQYIKEGNCNVLTKGKEQCKPLSIFTEKDIWDLIEKYKIKICQIYYDQIINGELVPGEKRTGCAWCGFGCQYEDEDNNRYQRLAKREPNRYKSMMDKLGFRAALTFMGIKLKE